MFNLVYSPPPPPPSPPPCLSLFVNLSAVVKYHRLYCSVAGFDSTHFFQLGLFCPFTDLDTMSENDRIVHNIYTKCHEWSSATCTLALSLIAACLCTGHTHTHARARTHTHTHTLTHTHTRKRTHTRVHVHYHVSDDLNSGCF